MAGRDPLSAQIRMFDCDEELSTTAVRWENLIAKDIRDDNRKNAQLLLMAGEKVYDIYDTLIDTEDKYKDVKGKLNNDFKPMKDTAMAIYLFRETAQKAGETCDQYVTRLKGMAKHCEFADLNAEIRAQIVQKTLNKKLRREVLKHPDWKLEDVLKEARSLEASEAHAGDIERGYPEESTVNFVKKRQQSRKPKPSDTKSQETKSKGTCNKCGGAWPHEGGMEKSPARGRKCNKCRMIGHYGKVCRNKETKKGKVHNISDKNSEDNEYLFKVGESLKLPHVIVKIGRHSVKFLVDTGSSLDIIDKETFHLIGKPVLQKSKVNVYTYDSKSALKVVGQFHTCLESKKRYKETNVIVIDTVKAGNLLSYNTASELGLVKVTANAINTSLRTQGGKVDIVQKFPPLFIGVGKLKGYQAKIHTDPSVAPVA